MGATGATDIDSMGAFGGLVTATQSDEGEGWRSIVYPRALEGSVCFQSRPARYLRRPGAWSSPQKNDRDANRRAARRIRRYTVANRLSVLATLTWEQEPDDRDAAFNEVGNCIRRVRSGPMGGHRFPYVCVIERGEAPGRFHSHLLLPESVAPMVEGAWNSGFPDLVRGFEDADDLRSAAEYVSKEFGTWDRAAHSKRYHSAKGFQPEKLVSPTMTRASDAVSWSIDVMGALPAQQLVFPGLTGVPVHTMRWDH